MGMYQLHLPFFTSANTETAGGGCAVPNGEIKAGITQYPPLPGVLSKVHSQTCVSCQPSGEEWIPL